MPHRDVGARPGHLGPALGREAGRLLVADVDHAQAAALGAQVDAPDVTAVQREDRFGARPLQREGDQVAGQLIALHRLHLVAVAGIDDEMLCTGVDMPVHYRLVPPGSP
jgi:hypothetical protein